MISQFLMIKDVLPKPGLEEDYNSNENNEPYTKNNSNKNN